MRYIPLRDTPNQTLQVLLANQLVSLSVRWMPLASAWAFGIIVDGLPILTGRQMPIRSPLVLDSRFEGELVVVPLSATDAEAGLNAWGVTHGLYWIEPHELGRP